MLNDAGASPDVANVVTGEGGTVGQALVDSNVPEIISLT
jgi:acyl-CoA reductase-like NAD-dependent aldehyde dehydrogenase